MQFEGVELRDILGRQSEPVDVYDSKSFRESTISAAAAVALVEREKYFGVGHRGRIRFIRRADGAIDLRAASRTVDRPRNQGVFVGPRVLLEHRGERSNGRMAEDHRFRNRVLIENTFCSGEDNRPKLPAVGDRKVEPKHPLIESNRGPQKGFEGRLIVSPNLPPIVRFGGPLRPPLKGQ